MYSCTEQLGTLPCVADEALGWGEWIYSDQKEHFPSSQIFLSCPSYQGNRVLTCFLQMHILDIEAGSSLCERLVSWGDPEGWRRGVGSKDNSYRPRSSFRVSPRVKTILLPPLVGIGVHKRWVHFFTLISTPSYEMDWTDKVLPGKLEVDQHGSKFYSLPLVPSHINTHTHTHTHTHCIQPRNPVFSICSSYYLTARVFQNAKTPVSTIMCRGHMVKISKSVC